MNSDAEGEGWFFRIEIDDTDAFEALMDQAAYDEYLETLELMDVLAELAALEAADSFVRAPYRSVRNRNRRDAARGRRSDPGRAGGEDGARQRSARSQPLDLPPPIDEAAVIAELRALAAKNAVKKSLIGMGYHGTHTPPVILRNVLENPAGTPPTRRTRRRSRRAGWKRC